MSTAERCRCWFHAAFLASVLCAPPAGAHVGDRVFVAWELPTADLPDLHDGTLEDWEAVVPAATLTNEDLQGAENWPPDPQNPGDFVLRMFMAWNDGAQQLYLGFEVVDDVAHRGDNLGIFVDADHSGGRYTPFSQASQDLETTTGAQYDHVWTVRDEGDDWTWRGYGPIAWAWGGDWKDAARTTDGEAPARTVIEMKVTPWDALGTNADESHRSHLGAGRIIGFQLSYADYDFDLEGVWDIGGVLTVTSSGLQENAGVFADVQLVGCTYLDCSQGGTAVAPDSWGRIKATWR